MHTTTFAHVTRTLTAALREYPRLSNRSALRLLTGWQSAHAAVSSQVAGPLLELQPDNPAGFQGTPYLCTLDLPFAEIFAQAASPSTARILAVVAAMRRICADFMSRNLRTCHIRLEHYTVTPKSCIEGCSPEYAFEPLPDSDTHTATADDDVPTDLGGLLLFVTIDGNGLFCQKARAVARDLGDVLGYLLHRLYRELPYLTFRELNAKDRVERPFDDGTGKDISDYVLDYNRDSIFR